MNELLPSIKHPETTIKKLKILIMKIYLRRDEGVEN